VLAPCVTPTRGTGCGRACIISNGDGAILGGRQSRAPEAEKAGWASNLPRAGRSCRRPAAGAKASAKGHTASINPIQVNAAMGILNGHGPLVTGGRDNPRPPF